LRQTHSPTPTNLKRKAGMSRALYLIFFRLSFIPILLLIGTAHNALAEIHVSKMKGTHQLIRPEYQYLSPIYGCTLLKTNTLHNLRFYGNYEISEGIEIAKDSTSRLIQILFPSHDRVHLTPNQIPGDPVSHFSAKTIGKLVNKITDFYHLDIGDRSDWTVLQAQLEEEFYQLLFLDLDIHGYLNRLKMKQTQIENNIERLKELLIRTLNARRIESLQTEINELNNQLTHLTETIKLKQSDATQERVRHWKKKHLRNFVQSLVGSLIETQGPNARYLPHTAEQVLTAFLCAKSEKKEDLVIYLEQITERLTPEARQLLSIEATRQQFSSESSSYTIQEYLEWDRSRRDWLDHDTAAQLQTNPEKAVFLIYTQELYNNLLPPMVSFSTAEYQDLQGQQGTLRFPDCAETALRNLINVLLYDTQSKTFDAGILKSLDQKYNLQIQESLIHFYETHTSFGYLFDNQSHHDWSQQVVSALNSRTIKYRKPTLNPVCELRAGLSNLLSVLDVLLFPNDPIYPNSNSERLDRICKTFSRNEFKLDWQLREGSRNDIDMPMESFVIQFLVNQKPSFEWQFEPGHSAIVDPNRGHGNFSLKIGVKLILELLKNNENPLFPSIELLDWFMSDPLFAAASSEPKLKKNPLLLQRILFSNPITTTQSRIQFSHKILNSEWENLYPAAKRIISLLPSQNLQTHAFLLNTAIEKKVTIADELKVLYSKLLDQPERVRSSLSIAIQHNYLALFKHLMQSLSKDQLNEKDSYGITPLYEALDNGRTLFSRALIEHLDSARLIERNALNSTLLHAVITNGDQETFELLLNKLNPEQLNLKDGSHETPLNLAMRLNRTEFTRSLIERLSTKQVSYSGTLQSIPLKTTTERNFSEIPETMTHLNIQTLEGQVKLPKPLVRHPSRKPLKTQNTASVLRRIVRNTVRLKPARVQMIR
jgi:hypothetical protein